MATTVNVQNNYGQLTVIDGNVQLPGGRQMPLEEYEDLWQREEWAMQGRREQLEQAKAEKARDQHTLDELVSMMAILAGAIEALRKEVADHA